VITTEVTSKEIKNNLSKNVEKYSSNKVHDNEILINKNLEKQLESQLRESEELAEKYKKQYMNAESKIKVFENQVT